MVLSDLNDKLVFPSWIVKSQLRADIFPFSFFKNRRELHNYYKSHISARELWKFGVRKNEKSITH